MGGGTAHGSASDQDRQFGSSNLSALAGMAAQYHGFMKGHVRQRSLY